MRHLAFWTFAILLVLAADARAQQCSGYYCPFGSCTWYEHIVDEQWDNGCGAWYYGGWAYDDVSTLCSVSNNHHGTISSNGAFINGGLIKQGFTTFTTASGARDAYSLQFTIDLSGMQSGDSLAVVVKDLTASTSTVVATFTSNTACNGQGFSFTNPGWAGHTLEVRFEAAVGHTTTKVKVDNVTFWQSI